MQNFAPDATQGIASQQGIGHLSGDGHCKASWGLAIATQQLSNRVTKPSAESGDTTQGLASQQISKMVNMSNPRHSRGWVKQQNLFWQSTAVQPSSGDTYKPFLFLSEMWVKKHRFRSITII